MSVIQHRGLDLDGVRVILDQDLTAGFGHMLLQFPKQLGHLCGVEEVDGKPLMDSGLDGMSNAMEMISELIFNPA